MIANWKPDPVSRKVARRRKLQTARSLEDKAKRLVRSEDRTCRFPRCGCRRYSLALHVSHQEHKGAGGNPTGERSDPSLLILLCRARHRENKVSIHFGTLRVRALTVAGTRGPCAFDVDRRALTMSLAEMGAGLPRWCEVARERSRGVLEPTTPEQDEMLAALAEMVL